MLKLSGFTAKMKKRCSKLAKIKWKKKAEVEQEKQLREQRKAEKEKFKNKKFTTLSSKEKDALLEQIAKDLGYL